MEFKSILYVGLGSFLGGSLRYVSTYLIDRKLTGEFPWSILFINALGSFLIGFTAPLLNQYGWTKDSAMPLFISVGVFGGFTTFSTFSLQTLRLAQDGHWWLAFMNALASVVCCVVSVFLGLRLGDAVFN